MKDIHAHSVRCAHELVNTRTFEKTFVTSHHQDQE